MLQLNRRRHSRRLIRASPSFVQELLDSESVWEELIELDAPRTFPSEPCFDEKYQASLIRILCAYTNLNPQVGYCQGMSLIAGLLLLVSGGREAESLIVFVCLMDDYGLRGFYETSFPLLLSYQDALNELVSQTYPDISEHFCRVGLRLEDLANNWFLSLYIHCLPLPAVLIIWDRLMCDGLPAVLLVALSLLGSVKNIVLAKPLDDIFATMKSFRTSTSDVEAEVAGSLIVRRSHYYTVPHDIAGQVAAV
jgi:TBC1 domain family protein 1